MRKLFPTHSFLFGLGLAWLAAAPAAHGQASSIYALGTFTADFRLNGQSATRGAQVLVRLDAGSPTIETSTRILGIGQVARIQQLVGLDTRPASGQLYALGYDNTAGASPNAQVYLLNLGDNAVVAQPVGSPITLDLGLSNRTDLDGYNLVVGVGFDFNPRTDQLRVTGRNGANYRLSPATGQVVARDADLTYAAAGNAEVMPANPPFVGTVAHTNSAIGLMGTTLYDVDETPNNGVLSMQSLMPTSSGVLMPLSNIKVKTSPTADGYGIGSSTFDLDIFTDQTKTGAPNTAYLLELTHEIPNSFGRSNLFAFDLSTGTAVRLGNVVPAGQALRLTNIAAAPASPPYVWTGAVSTNWDRPGNWNTNAVPGAATDVFIPGPGPTVRNQPTVNNSQQAHSVVLDSSPQGPAVLTVAGTLNLTGDLLNGGSLTGPGTVALVGAASQDLGGAGLSQFGSLSVGAAGATLSGPATVARALTLTGSLAVAAGQPLTLLSNAGGTAYVVNSSGAVSGAATVQRYIGPGNPGLGYRHYAAPVTNTTVGDLATGTFAPVFNAAYNTSSTPGTTAPFPTVFGYNQAQYENSPATAITVDFDRGFYSPAGPGDAWPSGTGFTVNLGGNELVDFVGTLANGDISTPGQGRSAKPNAGWQLLGNPYPSPLDWNQVVRTGLVNIAPTLYVYKSSGQYAGSYASYLNGQATNGGTNVVPVAQGFFVRTAAVGAVGNINFTNGQRLTTAAPAGSFQRTAADERPQLLLELSSDKLASQTAIYCERGATAGFDTDFDAPALPLTNGLLLASEAGAEALAINGQPALSDAATVTVPLRLAVAAAGPYVLRVANLANLPAGYRAYLRDAAQNTYTDLAATPTLALSLAAGAAPGRFAVLFTNASPLATAPAALAALATVFPSPACGAATLVLPRALRGSAASTVQLLNTLGQIVLTRTLPPGGADALELPLAGLAAGVYTVRATTAAGLVARRLVVE